MHELAVGGRSGGGSLHPANTRPWAGSLVAFANWEQWEFSYCIPAGGNAFSRSHR